MVRNLNWYFRLKPNQFASVADDVNTDLYTLQEVVRVFKEHDPELLKKYQEEFDTFRMAYESLRQQEH